MKLAPPKPSQVIKYAYLWADEHADGREEGTKDRPCAITLTTAEGVDGTIIVWVLPITHTPPQGKDNAVEIPANVASAAGLDRDRQWVVLTEANQFIWPGPDLRPITPDTDASPLYGYLTGGFFRTLRDRFVANYRSRSIRTIKRSE